MEDAKLIITALQTMTADAKDAFIWWVAIKGIGSLVETVVVCFTIGFVFTRLGRALANVTARKHNGS